MASTAAVSLLSLIEIKLHKDNYSEWKYMISPLLHHLDGLGHINGSTSRPNKDDAAQYLDWVRKDTLLIMVINSTLSQSILSVLPTALTETDYTCYTLWEFLKELCSTQAPADPFSLLLEDPNNESINRSLGVEVEDEKGMDFIRRYHKVASVAVGKVLPSELQEKVKDFIKTKGWAVDSVDCKTKKETRYMSPDEQKISSLVKVCEYFINNSDGVGSSEKPSKKRLRKSVKTVVQSNRNLHKLLLRLEKSRVNLQLEKSRVNLQLLFRLELEKSRPDGTKKLTPDYDALDVANKIGII